MNQPINEEEVRAIAYALWEEEGRPEGGDLERWLKAEEIWRERQRQAATSPKSESASQSAAKPKRTSDTRRRTK